MKRADELRKLGFDWLLNPKKLAYSFYNLVGIWRGFLAYES